MIAKHLRNKKLVKACFALLALGCLLLITTKDKEDNSKEKEVVKEQVESSCDYKGELEKSLENIFSMVEGVGKAKVFVTFENNGEKIYAKDIVTEESEEKEKRQYKLDEKLASEKENGLPVIVEEICPEIKGIIIVAEGGGSVTVKNSLIKAAQAITGLEVNKIEVMKMKIN